MDKKTQTASQTTDQNTVDNTAVLDIFSAPAAAWFRRVLKNPTPVQYEAWPAISGGCHTLVSAPTGTGKTLSAFLVFIDKLIQQAEAGTLERKLQVIYISPLKSLAGDIRENLRKPLDGIFAEIHSRNKDSSLSMFDINVMVRTGDTSAADRKKMVKTPPHILITTPESLYLLLTSDSGNKMLSTAKVIILDELHAMIDSKRGAHLMMTIARLDKLCENPLQRIGLSATIEPLDLAAEYLSPDEVIIAAPKMQKRVDIRITSPLPDINMTPNGTIWPDIARTVYDLCMSVKSVIAFVDGRMFAEKLAFYVNKIAGSDFAFTHHGSVSKERRHEAETALRDGKLRLLCATSSMELGIDVGDIELVLQVGCPYTISSTMQRLGRAGHNPGRVSVMHMLPRTAPEGFYCGLTAKVAGDYGVEHSNPPTLCFDVLAQHLVSMAVNGSYTISDAMEIMQRAYPFKSVTESDVAALLKMLSGDYEHDNDIPVRPRLLYDRINGTIEGDTYSRMLAISSAGTIPDRGLYQVKTEDGVKIGELDEEFVFEARVGDKFLLGSFAWRITSLQKDMVKVSPTNSEGATAPFFKGDWAGRSTRTGEAFGQIIRDYSNSADKLSFLHKMGLDEVSAQKAMEYLDRQAEATGAIPDDKVLIIEHFRDDAGDHQIMIHSIFGKQVNAPLSLLLVESARKLTGMDVGVYSDDNGILLFGQGGKSLPEGLLGTVSADTARGILETLLPSTPLFGITFRHNAARALMMGIYQAKRQPLWVQRLKGAEILDSIFHLKDHPLIRETTRECLDNYWDISGVEYLLKMISAGLIAVREIYTEKPSPMSLPLRRQVESVLLYDYSPTPSNVIKGTADAMNMLHLIEPSAEHLAKVAERPRLPEDEKHLHSLLMIEGDLIAGELEVPIGWLETLAKQNRVKYIEPGIWIAAEHEEEYINAFENDDRTALLHITRRLLRYRGAHTVYMLAERYILSEDTAFGLLNELCEAKAAIFVGDLYYHKELYEKARQVTVAGRRQPISTMPADRYAALITAKLRITAPPSEQLEHAVSSLNGQAYPLTHWENILLPIRVSNYRPTMLDTLLSQGNTVWDIVKDETEQNRLAFHRYDEIDWDYVLEKPDSETSSDPSKQTDTSHSASNQLLSSLTDDELLIYEALLKRGASFVQSLYNVTDGKSPLDALMGLAEKGLVHADSFIPCRQLIDKDKLKKATAAQRVNARTKNITSGRWELSRPLKQKTTDEVLDEIFKKVIIISKETVKGFGISWQQALEVLRIHEYTGRARRGYFIQGLSGMQYISENDFEGVKFALSQPQTGTKDDIIWLPAIDPLQPWGKSIPHMPERDFINAVGTYVALRSGVPVAVFEKQGQVLRVFDIDFLSAAIKAFVNDFSQRRIYASLKRITVKHYAEEAKEALTANGFVKSMQDFILYQGYK